MGLFGGKKSELLKSGVEAKAVIRESRPFDKVKALSGGAEPGESGILSHLDELGIGKRRYGFVLEVTPPGGEPYEVDIETKIPAKAESAGRARLKDLAPGLELPVRIDSSNPQNVEIDWPAFLDDPNRKKAVAKASSDHNVERYREEVATTETGRRLIEGNRQALPVWVQAVKGGNMKRKEFDKTVEMEVRLGRMDPADAEEAYRQLDG